MRSGTSRQGLRYAVRRSGRSVAYCALTIGCGTRDEAGYPAGIAHFTEHTIFRGTKRKSASTISAYLDRFGGELNAYTTKEEIVLHATVLKEDLSKAAGLLFELATEATFPDKEIETERGVVLDEIISYKDNPAEDVYDRFENLLFAGHPLQVPILGTAASVKKITPDMLSRFVAEKFIPSRMVFTVVADIPEEKLEKQVVKLIDKIFPDAPKARPQFSKGCGFTALEPFDKVVDKRHHEVNAVIGAYAPSLYEMPDRLTAAMFLNILGGPASNSLLNKELREKRGWVYGIECSYTQYADTGVAAITFGCDRPNLDACISAVSRILEQLKTTPLTPSRLRAYRKQMLGQLAISSEAGEAQCLSMGKSMLAWGCIMESDEVRAKLEAITPADIQSMARRIFSAPSTLIYL